MDPSQSTRDQANSSEPKKFLLRPSKLTGNEMSPSETTWIQVWLGEAKQDQVRPIESKRIPALTQFSHPNLIGFLNKCSIHFIGASLLLFLFHQFGLFIDAVWNLQLWGRFSGWSACLFCWLLVDLAPSGHCRIPMSTAANYVLLTVIPNLLIAIVNYKCFIDTSSTFTAVSLKDASISMSLNEIWFAHYCHPMHVYC